MHIGLFWTQRLIWLQEQLHLCSCLPEYLNRPGQKCTAWDVTVARSGFGVNPRWLEPKESLLLIWVSVTLGFLHTRNKNNANKQAKIVEGQTSMSGKRYVLSAGQSFSKRQSVIFDKQQGNLSCLDPSWFFGTRKPEEKWQISALNQLFTLWLEDNTFPLTIG